LLALLRAHHILHVSRIRVKQEGRDGRKEGKMEGKFFHLMIGSCS